MIPAYAGGTGGGPARPAPRRLPWGPMAPDAVPDLPGLYRETRGVVADLASDLDADQLAAPVPTCPGWSVADVLRHLTAVAEDVVAGRLTGPPSDAEAAAGVMRFADRSVDQVLAHWAEVAPALEERLAVPAAWPAVVDVLAHQHDIRGAVGRPGARDSQAVVVTADRLLGFLRPPLPLAVHLEDAEVRLGPDGVDPLVLRTSRFEAFRWRLGRRSRSQLAAMDWSADPGPVLDALCIFGPSPVDIIE